MIRLSRQKRLLLNHVVDSLILAGVAGIAAAILCTPLAKASQPIVEFLAARGAWAIAACVAFAILTLGSALPNQVFSVFMGIRMFPRHWGLVVKVTMGFVICLLVMPATDRAPTADELGQDIGWLAGGASLGLMAAYLMARLRTGGSRVATNKHAETDGQTADNLLSSGEWLNTDQPIHDQAANAFAEHQSLANRILDRLLTHPDTCAGIFPSIALMGAYGSGKTSICNLVHDLYSRRVQDGERPPELLFCRYEAWQYVTADAAAKGLVEAATERILRVADVPELWRLPDQYVSAIKAGGGAWAAAAAAMVGTTGQPSSVLSAIGDVLVRFNKRLVIFVDDLDRIEKSATQAQHAVTQALNQLQNVRNVQYVVAVGPTRPQSGERSVVTYDLLKLTRFQEILPKMQPERIAHLTRSLREQALADRAVYCPWADVYDEDIDPLTWLDWREGLDVQDMMSNLVGLLDTPRALKSALRETHVAWNGGLKGEIDWYDLLLACALRVAEPRLFEWIERDRAAFFQGPSSLRSGEDEKELARNLKEKVLNSILSPGDARDKAVMSTMGMLFPAFGSRIKGTQWDIVTGEWGQKIGSGVLYLERVLSGRVPEGQMPDQPSLQFIQRTMQNGLDEGRFQSMYLESVEKLTGAINKFVQFSGLLTHKMALQICDVILAWMAIPEHVRQWPATSLIAYHASVMGDVYKILRQSGARQPEKHAISSDDMVVSWAKEKIDQYATIAWEIPEALLHFLGLSGGLCIDPKAVSDLRQHLAELLREAFIEGNRPLTAAVGMERFAIYGFRRALRAHKGYAEFRPIFTQKLIKQAEEDITHSLKATVILSLVSPRHPITKGEVPVEAYEFDIDQKSNADSWDMDVVEPALRSWVVLALPDPVAQRAFEKLKEVYGLMSDGKPDLAADGGPP